MSAASITFQMEGFNQQIAALHAKNGRSARSMVTYWGRKLLRKLAYKTPLSHGQWAARGRLRAGWWPAATALGVTNVYTPAPNLGEGSFVDGRETVGRPSITLINAVPYVTRLKVGMAPFEAAAAEVESQMRHELEREYRGVCH